jgi:hypothetical protein
MNRQKQYEILVEIVAQARLLSATSDNDEVSLNTHKIKPYGVNAAVALGYSDVKFKSDSIKRYQELLEQNK